MHGTPLRHLAPLLHLEALAVDDCWARLIVLALGDPHLLERAQRRQDRTTDPNAVLSLWRSNHLDLHGRRGQSSELFGHSLTNALEHGSATGKNHVGIEILADIHIAFPRKLDCTTMPPPSLYKDHQRLKDVLNQGA